MTIGPSSLRFWDKLGLGPRWGRKDVRVCVAWVNAGDQSSVDPRIHDWLTALRAEWERSSFGTMKFVSTCPDNGVWSCTSDGLRETSPIT
jgi:mediator of RNA polymerase II transcription subunit 13